MESHADRPSGPSGGLTRRRLLQLGAAGATGAVLGAVGLSRLGWAPIGGSGAPATGAAGGSWVEPPVLSAVGGVLQVELTAAWTTTSVAGRTARVLSYDGALPGRTWRLAPGDRLRVRVRNDLDVPTNLHVHGLHVPPTGAGDDPLVTIEPRGVHDYDYTLPLDHPTGTFWYHPHHHGTVADQVYAGLYGAILLVGPDEPTVDADRVMVISDLSLTGDGHLVAPSPRSRMGGREGDLVLLNGASAPTLTTTAGTVERWRVVNACTSRYLRLALAGASFTVLGIDGHRVPGPRQVEEVTLAPGNRADLIVVAPTGTSLLRTLPVDRGGTMMGAGASAGGPIDLLRLLAAPGPARSAAPEPTGHTVRDLRTATPARTRQISLGGGMGMGMGTGFTIDGRTFDPARADLPVTLGEVQEWTFTNTSTMSHPIHLHVWPMQVTARNGAPVSDLDVRDVVDVPAGGTTTVRIAFSDYPGTTVVHCHVLDHEDLGMMATVVAT